MPHKTREAQRQYLREYRRGLRRGRPCNRQLQLLLALIVSGSPGECWIWPGSKRGRRPHLYGFLSVRGKRHATHRFAYELVREPIPGGLTLDHLCRTPLCFNPAHLEPVTLAENVRRAHVSTDTVCAHGHEWTNETTYIDKNGTRYCRPCQRAGKRRRRAAARERRATSLEAVSPLGRAG